MVAAPDIPVPLPSFHPARMRPGHSRRYYRHSRRYYRHSRVSGNPGRYCVRPARCRPEFFWIPAYAGMTVAAPSDQPAAGRDFLDSRLRGNDGRAGMTVAADANLPRRFRPQLFPQTLQFGPGTAVQQPIANLNDDAAQEGRVDPGGQGHFLAD